MELVTFQPTQVSELKTLFGGHISLVRESCHEFIFIPNTKIPGGVDTDWVDLLFCPTKWGGYNSRLFFSRQVKTRKMQNWNNVNVRIVEKNWFAFSWAAPEGLRLAETLMIYLEAAK